MFLYTRSQRRNYQRKIRTNHYLFTDKYTFISIGQRKCVYSKQVIITEFIVRLLQKTEEGHAPVK